MRSVTNMQKKESAERKMSKIKTKKVLTPEQKKKRIRNIIIVAVILVAASVATYWMQPQNKALAANRCVRFPAGTGGILLC